MCCTLLALLAAGVLIDVMHRPGPTPQIDATSRESLILGGCVVEPAVFSEDREQFTLELDPGARARVTLPLRDGETPQLLAYGQEVEVEARVRPPHNFANPGAFDYAGYLARQNIFWTATASAGTKAAVLPGRCGSRFFQAIFAMRTAALSRLERLYANDSYATGMLQAILIGDSFKLEKIWTEHFRRTGTYHALVISGLHISVLAGVLLFLLRLCMLGELPALAVAAVGAWVYALVSGWSAPVIRAAGGFTLFLAGRYFFRQRQLMNLLAVVAIVYLVYDPGQMFEASFQLSFLSVAAIGALAVPLLEATSALFARALRGIHDTDRDLHMEARQAQFRVELRLLAETIAFWTRLPVKWALTTLTLALRLVFFAFEMVAISTVIQIGLALPMAVYFHRVSLSGLSANLLIVPAMSLVVPIGFVAIFTGWPLAAGLANWLLLFSEKVAAWHAAWEPNWRIPDPPLWLSLAFVAALLALAFAAAKKSAWRWAAVISTLGMFVLLLWQPRPPAIERGKLELTAIDVGQGDSLLVAFPDGKLMVIDGGGVLAFGRRTKPRLDIGEDVVSPYLWSRSIRRIDVLVLTHEHEDHIGGLVALLDNFHPKELWTGAQVDSQLFTKVIEKARQLGVQVRAMDGVNEIPFGGTQLRVLSPPRDYRPSGTPKNNDSLAFRIAYGTRSFLLTGDMEKPMEDLLLGDQLLDKVDVLKVGHHGSKTSSSPLFLDMTRPAFAIISVGFENSFRHPHPEVLARLEEHHAEILRTDLLGLISVKTDGRHLEVGARRWSAEREHVLSAF